MKKVLLSVLLFVLILVPVLLIAPSFFAWNNYKPQIKEQVQEYTGLELDIAGDLKIALLPSPYAYVSGVSVRNPASGSNDPFLQLERLDLVLKVGPLLSGQLALSSVEMVKPVIALRQSSDGRWNWQTEKLSRLMNKDAESSVSDEKAGQSNFDLSLDNVEVQDGDITFAQTGRSPFTLKDIDLTISAESLSGPFQVKGDVNFQGDGIAFDINSGRLSPDTKAFPVNAEITADAYGAQLMYSGVFEPGEEYALQGQTKIIVDDVNKTIESVSDTSQKFPAKPLKTSGLLTVTPQKAEYKNLAVTYGENVFGGAVSLSDNYSVAKVDLQSSSFTLYPKVSSVAVNGIFAISPNLYEARSLTAQIDDTKITGALSYVPAARGTLKANLNVGALDLDKFAASTGQSKTLTKQDVKKMVKPLLLPFDAQVQMNAASLKQGQMVYQDVSVSGNVKGESLHVDHLRIGNFKNTTVSASGDVANLANLDDINAKISVSSQDFTKLAEFVKLDMSTLPTGVKGGSIAMQYTGSLDAGQGIINIGAMNGQVIANGDVKDPIETLGLENLTVQIKHPNFEQLAQTFSGQGTGFTSLGKPLDFYASVDKSSDSATLSNLKATIGSVPIRGSLSITGLQSKPNLKGDLSFGNIVLTTDANNKSRANVGWSNDPIKTDLFHTINMDVKLSAESLQYNDWKMNAPKVQLTLDDGAFSFQDFSAGMYEGQIFLDANINAPKTGPVSVDTKAQIREVSLEPLVKSFTGGRILQGKGLVNVDANVAGKGASQAALINSLKGSGLTNGENIILEGFDLGRFARAMSSETKPGDTVLGLWKTSTKGGKTQFDSMDGSFDIQNGVVNITKLNLDGPEALVTTTGSVSLPKWYLDSTFGIELKEEAADSPPFEIHVAGPLDNPAQTLGQGILEDYLSRKINRKLQDVIQDKLGDKIFGGAVKQQAPARDGKAEQSIDAEPAESSEQEPQQENLQSDPREEAMKGLIRGLLQ